MIKSSRCSGGLEPEPPWVGAGRGHSGGDCSAVVSILGTVGARGSGVPATSVTLNLPTAAVPLAGGGFLIADSKNNVVRRVNASGEITTVAGNGQDNATGGDPNTHGDGGVATAAELDDPTDAVPTPDGGFLIADASNNLTGADGGGGAVRKVSASGVITTIAGGPTLSGGNYQGICLGKTDAIGDGCPATQAVLGNPTSAVQTSDGSILIADGGLGLVRRISGGTITSVAGGGSGSCVGATDTFGDNCPATDAILGFPTAAIPLNIAGAAVNTPGTGYLIADEENCLVHYVDGSGVIHLAAGNPTNLCTADPTSASGPATAVGLNQPSDVRPTASGGFLIADAGNCRVLKVSSVNSGTVTTVVPPAAGCSFSTELHLVVRAARVHGGDPDSGWRLPRHLGQQHGRARVIDRSDHDRRRRPFHAVASPLLIDRDEHPDRVDAAQGEETPPEPARWKASAERPLQRGGPGQCQGDADRDDRQA